MALSNRTFNREVSTRFLKDIANVLEEAANAEAVGNFEECLDKEKGACTHILNLVYNVNIGAQVAIGEIEARPADDQSFWEEVLPPLWEDLKKAVEE